MSGQGKKDFLRQWMGVVKRVVRRQDLQQEGKCTLPTEEEETEEGSMREKEQKSASRGDRRSSTDRVQVVTETQRGAGRVRTADPHSSLFRTEKKICLPMVVREKEVNLPSVKDSIEGQEWAALLDSRASKSFSHPVGADYSKRRIGRIRQGYYLSRRTGQEVGTVTGFPDIKVSSRRRAVFCVFLIAYVGYDSLLGLDYLQRAALVPAC